MGEMMIQRLYNQLIMLRYKNNGCNFLKIYTNLQCIKLLTPDRCILNRRIESKNFTLIFPKIPESWQVFSFTEFGSSGRFEVLNIKRNDTGVYQIKLM